MSETIINQIQGLRRMSVGQLRLEWERLYNEPTRSRNKTFLWRRLAWRIQELKYGGLSPALNLRIAEIAPTTFERSQVPKGFLPPNGGSASSRHFPRRDPRLPATGSTIVREYRRQTLHLKVLDDGFELDGVHYDSLSEAARVVTGQRWNGPLFWGLRERKRKR